MSRNEFVNVVSPSKEVDMGKPPSIASIFKDSFELRTLFAVGALVQCALVLVLPSRVAALPAAILVLYSILSTLSQLYFPSRYPFYADDIVQAKATAQLPSVKGASFGSEPADQPVVVFHIGVRFDHPLGPLAPGAKEVSTYFKALVKEAMARQEEFGMLGTSSWRSMDRSRANTNLNIFYFRDVEGLHRFAHDKLHRETMSWWNKTELPHIGIYHETFSVPRKAYETIYLNCPRLLMGAMSIKCTDEAGEEKWVNPLVDASTGVLKTQYGRMGKTRGSSDH